MMFMHWANGDIRKWVGQARASLAHFLNQVDDLLTQTGRALSQNPRPQHLSGTGPGPAQPIYHETHNGPAQSLSLSMIGVLFKEKS